MIEDSSNSPSRLDLICLAADIVSAYASFSTIPSSELPALIRTVHAALDGVSKGDDHPHEPAQRPAVSVRRSIQDDHIVCLEDGKKLKMLKRYLRTKYNLSPDEYRKKWGLPADYPMVAPSYSTQRSEFAKKIGLGRRRINP